MNGTNLRELDTVALVALERDFAMRLANAKLSHSVGQLENSAQLRGLRRDRARVKTELRRREIAEGLPEGELVRRHGHAALSHDVPASTEAPRGERREGGLLAGLRRRLGRDDG